MPTPPIAPELAVLAKDVGVWEAEVTVRVSKDAAPQTSGGVMTSHLIGQGRWLVSDFKNETSGFEGHGIYGWDPAKGKYVGTWVDSMSTFLQISEGTWDATSNTMTMLCEVRIPGRPPFTMRQTTTTAEPGTHVFRSFLPGADGAEFEMMTVTYRKRA